MAWLPISNWNYRRKITITENSGNDLTDYQVRIDLDSSNFDFSKANSDGSDIRFTASDGVTLLNYWIEEWDSANQSARIWVKVPSIPANSSVNIFMYYGNSSATSESNPDDVFILYDDFNGTELDTTKWTAYQEGSMLVKVENGELFMGSETVGVNYRSAGVVSKKYALNPIGLHLKVRWKDVSTVSWHATAVSITKTNAYDTEKSFIDLQGDGVQTQSCGKGNINRAYEEDVRYGDTINSRLTSVPHDGNYHIWNLYIDQNGKGKIIGEDDVVYSPTGSMSLNAEFYVVMGTRISSALDKISAMYVDYVFLAQYTSPEPTYTVGSEGTVPTAQLKCWNGSAWQDIKSIKYWDGNSWVQAQAGYYWDGTQWVQLWNGT